MTLDQAARRRAFARWHRRVAFVVAAWLALLAATGLAINHAHGWGLDRAPLPGTLQRWVYGIDSGAQDVCAGTAVAARDCAGVFARLDLPSGSLLLSRSGLLLLDDAGQLVEKLAAGQLGLESLRAGLREGASVYLRDGRRTVRADAGMADWQTLAAEESDALNARPWHTADDAAEPISWERLLLDLHAARFLGPLASAFTDLMAGLILLLALSGLWLWRVKRQKG